MARKSRIYVFVPIGILMLFLLTLSGCTSSSDAISSFERPSCLAAISKGRTLLGETAHFNGVRYLSKKVFTTEMRSVMALEHSHKFSFASQSVCIVGWKGKISKSLLRDLKNSKKVLVINKKRSTKNSPVIFTIVSAGTGKILATIVSANYPIGFSQMFPHGLGIPGIR